MISEFDGGSDAQASPEKMLEGISPDTKKVMNIALQGSASGIALGIGAFIRHRRVDITPTEKCKDPVAAFADLLTAEMENPSKYPFSKSLLKMLFKYLNAEVVNIAALHKFGHDKEIESFTKFIGMEVTIRFLEENLEEALGLFKKIREE